MVVTRSASVLTCPYASLPVPKQPKFGWSWAAHRAIEQTAAELLPSSSYKDFITAHMDDINQASVDQDRLHMGPGHFVNLENYAGREGNASPGTPAQDRVFKNVAQAFSRSAQRARTQEFTHHPLTEGELHSHTGDNVFAMTLQQYQKLVGLLKQAPITGTARRQNSLGTQIQQTIGALAHYIGDLHQPLHATRFHTWKMAYPRHRNSHSFLERQVLNAADQAAWQQRMKAQPSLPPDKLDEPSLKHLLLRQIEQSYLHIFKLVQREVRVRQNHSNASIYFDTLRSRWKPVVEARMEDATRNLATILQSAWQEAGYPDLPGFHLVSNKIKPPKDGWPFQPFVKQKPRLSPFA